MRFIVWSKSRRYGPYDDWLISEDVRKLLTLMVFYGFVSINSAFKQTNLLNESFKWVVFMFSLKLS